MKFGIHSLLFSETFLEKDLPLLDKASQMGFSSMEIIPFDLDRFPAKAVRQRAGDLGLQITTGIGLPAEANPISPDPAIRAAAWDYGRKLIDQSLAAGSLGLGGVDYAGWGYLTGKMRTAEEWTWGVEAFRRLAEYAYDANPDFFLAVEPVNRFESHFLNTAAQGVEFVRAVDMPNAKVHLDTFHLIREEDNFAEAILSTGPYLGYVHACENQRGIPGTGLVPWKDFFRSLQAIDYQGIVTIESFDPDMPEIARLCCIWRKLADSPEQLATQGKAYLEEVWREVSEELK